MFCLDASTIGSFGVLEQVFTLSHPFILRDTSIVMSKLDELLPMELTNEPRARGLDSLAPLGATNAQQV